MRKPGAGPFVAIFLCAVGCGASPKASSSDAVVNNEESLPVVAPAASGPRLIAASSEHGLRELDGEGNILRQISRSPASRPRFVPGAKNQVMFISGLELRTVDLDTGAETRAATIPGEVAEKCGIEDFDPSIHVHTDDAFVIDADGKSVCLEVMDRNINMASASLKIHIDLRSGKGETSVEMSEACKETAAVKGCETADEPDPRSAAREYPFALEKARITSTGAAPRLIGPGEELQIEATSASGRWLIISGEYGDGGGDYIYRSLFAFDRASGRIFTVPSAAGPWPEAIATDKLATLDEVETASAVGESTIRAVGTGDLISIDQLLLVPGKRVVEVGQLAR